MIRPIRFLILPILIFLLACQPELVVKKPVYDYEGMDRRTIAVHKKVEDFLIDGYYRELPFPIDRRTRIDSLKIDDRQRLILIYFSKHFSYFPLRDRHVSETFSLLRDRLGRKYRRYRLAVFSLNTPIGELVPNIFREADHPPDRLRLPRRDQLLPVVRRQKQWQADLGLQDRNVALWNSHGWYFNLSAGRWEWQRPRLFQTVEDLLPTAIVLPYLVPMLENAGANVFLPRERDWQTNEIIVDNDSTMAAGQGYSEFSNKSGLLWETGADRGFGYGRPPYADTVNPFRQGSYRQVASDTVESASARWAPQIPQTGDYAVYVSWHSLAQSSDSVLYSVFHAGGRTDFIVNQRIGGSTWIYLGTFRFHEGAAADSASVMLSNATGRAGQVITADAVRFGGGMGQVQRGGFTSGRPRFMEGARYYLQFAGFPDSLVWRLNSDGNDYKDDYQSRGEFVNYLYGAPFGPNRDRENRGLGVPIECSLAFHTDAGISANDTTIGTLMIYSVVGADTQVVFPDSVSRLANRDFADILQTQLVADLRAAFDSTWNRRALMESQYSEVVRPNVPSVILELLSHQNFGDMKFAQDPRFRFFAARSIYKGILKFINSRHGKKFQVQPLPVTHFSAVLDSAGQAVLSWRAQADPLEPTAVAERYQVYQRIEDQGFAPLLITEDTSVRIGALEPGRIYSFKVTALNRGGESFPSEILAVCYLAENPEPLLIVNGFDRICGPAEVDLPQFRGFLNFSDNGVPDHFDINYTGQQLNFDPASQFRLNDAPGHGASAADLETTIIAGNSFDFSYLHGRAARAAGYSFVSASDEALMDSTFNFGRYRLLDLILGEEKTTAAPGRDNRSGRQVEFEAFPQRLRQILRRFTDQGSSCLISGAYVGSDLFKNKMKDDARVGFGRNLLKIDWITDHAARTGRVVVVNDSILPSLQDLQFNSGIDPEIYTVESPDAIGPVQGAQTVMRYQENQFSAAVAWDGPYRMMVLGFPFETVLGAPVRNRLMADILRFLSFAGK